MEFDTYSLPDDEQNSEAEGDDLSEEDYIPMDDILHYGNDHGDFLSP